MKLFPKLDERQHSSDCPPWLAVKPATQGLSKLLPSTVHGPKTPLRQFGTHSGLKLASRETGTKPHVIPPSGKQDRLDSSKSHLTLIYLYARGGTSGACGAHLFADSGGGLWC